MAIQDLMSQVTSLRDQGLTDTLIEQELASRGYPQDQVQRAIMQAGDEIPPPGPAASAMPPPSYPTPQRSPAPSDTRAYDRIEEITENIIDEKWDELIAEVKKIIDWKERVEETQRKLTSAVEKLNNDFKQLHAGVLGKLDDYDSRMQEVGTELHAVGNVFKDVVPEFVENVKEMKYLLGKERTGTKKG